ncbi:MAG TPA: hypothetical protein VGI81_15685 [Tepidisphaeraceae bacterium]|jgi:hypothetical protein
MRQQSTNNGGIVPSLVRAFRASGFAISALVLVTLAAVLAPQLRRASGAPQQARPAAIADLLRYVRTQIRVYSEEHGGRAPGVAAGDASRTPDAATFIGQRTGYTDAQGAIGPSRSDTYRFGPYLPAVPANPVTARSGVLIVPGPVFPAADDTRPYGWMYCPQTQQFIANAQGVGPDGVPYTDY